MKKGICIKDMLLLQAVFLIYSISSVVSKFASEKEMLSMEFILLYGLDVLVLGIYALLWQQVIKKFELSIAYANKAVTLVWALIWGIFLFHERITTGKVVGIILVMLGILILNTGKEQQE
ncbi:MAG: EamA family transporter [Suilimivivens sp.]|nr:EamA family transporter [Lachnospiraceae bacterium]